MIAARSVRFGILPVALLGTLVAGCGTQRAGEAAGPGVPSRSASAVAPPSAQADLPCPGESPTPAPSKPTDDSGPAAQPGDHYAENHGFMVPIPLHGRQRCDGLAAVTRIQHALEPLRKRGDFDPASTRGALTRLGYAAAKVQSYQDGPTGVGFLIDASPMCLEGKMSSRDTKADAFGGYPDHFGCDQPRGGH
ncbi:hypothetical protein [Streptomyces sp. HUAS TT7]|uniref:hypothetical protein n=1 Tax=Streptomyces sp. HUAS TT7 TaxID=3447507 RepID=UPI003F656CE4